MAVVPRPELAKLSQAEIDHIELDSTEASPGTAKFLALTFTAMLFVVPIIQAGDELRHWRVPQVLDIGQPFAQAGRRALAGNWKGFWSACENGIRPETLHGHEAALENASVFKGYVQPRVQELLTGFFGVGNEKAILGEHGWLFYQPGIAYVTRSSIVNQLTLELTAKRMIDKGLEATPRPDPRPALVQLDRDCRQRGARLIVLPAPDKVMLQPGQLDGRLRRAGEFSPPNNVGYARLVNEMRSEGVDWFDPIPARVQASEIRFLEQDTHWNPNFMDSVAHDLAEHIRESVDLTQSQIPLRRVAEDASRIGDLVDVLRLSRQQAIFKPQHIRIEKIVDAVSGKAIEPDRDAEVLLLGDSYTNIYSRPEMGWGAGAGFGEHLAFWLQRRVDVIALNDGGATRSRAELARPENIARFGRKKVVIYEFAIRNLFGENWMPIPIPKPAAVTSAEMANLPRTILVPPAHTPTGKAAIAPSITARRNTTPRSAPEVESSSANAGNPPTISPGSIVVIGRIIQTSKVPAPGTAPYKDCLTFVKVRIEEVESGSYAGNEMIVVFLAMQDNEWLPPARYAIGDRLQMEVIPLSKAADHIRSMQRADDLEDYSLQPLYVVRGNPQ